MYFDAKVTIVLVLNKCLKQMFNYFLNYLLFLISVIIYLCRK